MSSDAVKKIFVTFEQDDHTRFTVARVENTEAPRVGDVLNTEQLDQCRGKGIRVEFQTAVKLNIGGFNANTAKQTAKSQLSYGERHTLGSSPPRKVAPAETSATRKLKRDIIVLGILAGGVLLYFIYTYFH